LKLGRGGGKGDRTSLIRSFDIRLSDHLPLELREREQDVEHEGAERGRGVELLGDRDEGDLPFVKGLGNAGEVEQAAREPVMRACDSSALL
jgi:hypothetical protein